MQAMIFAFVGSQADDFLNHNVYVSLFVHTLE